MLSINFLGERSQKEELPELRDSGSKNEISMN